MCRTSKEVVISIEGIKQSVRRVACLARLQPFDTSTEGGRSRERIRRAGLTTIATAAARGLSILASLITLPLTFRYLGPEKYGLWMVLVSIISFMGFADLGIGLGLVNAISEAYGKDDRAMAREYLTSALFMLLTIAGIVLLGAIVGYPFVPWMRVFNVKSPVVAAEGARAFVVLFAWFVLSIPLGVVDRAQTGLQQGYISQTVVALGSVATLFALIVVIYLRGDLAWLVFASTFGTIVAAGINAVILFWQEPWLWPTWRAYRQSSANKIFHLGLMFFVLQCAFAVGYTTDNLVITQILGASAVAAYAVPQRLFGVVSLVASMALGPLWPAYGEAKTRGDSKWMRKAFWGSMGFTLSITVSMSSILVLAGPWILRVFFGKELHASMGLLSVLAIWSVVSSISSCISMLLNGAGIVKSQALAAVVSSLTNLGLSILLTRRFGVLGVCAGSIVAQVFIAYPVGFVLVRRLFGEMGSGLPPIEIAGSAGACEARALTES